MSIIYTVFMIVILFGATIFVHELAHYLAARWMGLVIEAFSIGMGPAIWKKEHKGIVYKIGCLPIGGYVALPQLDPDVGNSDSDEEEKDSKRDIPPLSPWRKIPVQVAGVIGNVILAFIIAVAIYFSGSGAEYRREGAVLGYVSTNSPAYEAGLRAGDRIQSANGEDLESWDEFVIECALNDQVELDVKSLEGEQKNITMPTEEIDRGGRIISGIAKSTPCLVLSVKQGGSADQAGIQQKDVITEFDGVSVMGQQHLIRMVDEHAGETVPMTVERDGEEIQMEVTPEYNEEHDRALIGVTFNPFDINRKPLNQVKGWAMPVFRILQALVTPSEAGHAAASVGGPVKIFEVFWFAVQSSFLLALWFTGMININLAILNILPIPILDGGHLLFSIIEIVTGKPINAKVLMVIYKIFMVLLITLFALITFRDIRGCIPTDVPDPEEAESSGNITNNLEDAGRN